MKQPWNLCLIINRCVNEVVDVDDSNIWIDTNIFVQACDDVKRKKKNDC